MLQSILAIFQKKKNEIILAYPEARLIQELGNRPPLGSYSGKCGTYLGEYENVYSGKPENEFLSILILIFERSH